MNKMRGWGAVATYLLVAGLATLGLGVAGRDPVNLLSGLLLVVVSLATGLGRGEGTSWLRGEIDERRARAVDHAFRVAFVTLAWWVTAVAIYASRRSAPPEVFAAGTGVAVVAAMIEYARRLRRS